MSKTDARTGGAPLEMSVFYGISSPWAYFGAPRLAEIARRTGAKVTLRTMRVIEVNRRPFPCAPAHSRGRIITRWN